MLETGITHRHPLTFIRQHNARRAVQKAVEDKPVVSETGRLPRVSRLMALALRFEHLLACGAVHDQAELAELGHVTRARVTQIMNLLHLAPDIQEELLALPRIKAGRDVIVERQLRPIAAQADWTRQRVMWRRLKTQTRAAAERQVFDNLSTCLV